MLTAFNRTIELTSLATLTSTEHPIGLMSVQVLLSQTTLSTKASLYPLHNTVTNASNMPTNIGIYIHQLVQGSKRERESSLSLALALASHAFLDTEPSRTCSQYNGCSCTGVHGRVDARASTPTNAHRCKNKFCM
jgi:hypothetical protein